jgi:hypothetical protein
VSARERGIGVAGSSRGMHGRLCSEIGCQLSIDRGVRASEGARRSRSHVIGLVDQRGSAWAGAMGSAVKSVLMHNSRESMPTTTYSLSMVPTLSKLEFLYPV